MLDTLFVTMFYPAAEKKPETTDKVLVVVEDRKIGITFTTASYNAGAKEWFMDDTYIQVRKVIAWAYMDCDNILENMNYGKDGETDVV